jgi:hypothetical protein
MRLPDSNLLHPVTGGFTLLQLLLSYEHLDRAFLARPKQGDALQATQAEWTNVIVKRETVLIFGYRHRLAARRENIPYEICYAECCRPATGNVHNAPKTGSQT